MSVDFYRTLARADWRQAKPGSESCCDVSNEIIALEKWPIMYGYYGRVNGYVHQTGGPGHGRDRTPGRSPRKSINSGRMEGCMIETLKSLVIGSTRPHPIYECRKCGTSVDKEADVCPVCCSDSIAQFEIG
jgi:hypothetical protein